MLRHRTASVTFKCMIYNSPVLLILNAFLISGGQALSKKSPLIRRIRSTIPSKFPFSLPWYENGLEFSCTECSKCCQVDGDVWLAPEEILQISDYLNEPSIDSFRTKYVRAEIAPSKNNSIRDKKDQMESWMCLKRKEGSCIFLDPSGKCSIYDVRPVQCYTYPFWPSLLVDPEGWMEESVLPDDEVLGTDDRHWTRESGGCEGIGKIIDAVAKLDKSDLKKVDLNQMMKDQKEATIVGREEITAKRKEAKKHWKRFPVEEIKKSTWYL